MNDSQFVCARETGSDLNRDVEYFFDLQSAFDLLPPRFAFDVLHCDVRAAVVFANFVNRENVWMIQRRCSACFLEETPAAILLRDVLRWEQLQSYDTLKLCVVSFVDGAHAAGSDRFNDPVMRNALDGECFHDRGNVLV